MLPKPGRNRQWELVDATSDPLDTALDQVGPRFKRGRARRRITLTGLTQTTGISKTPLFRLSPGLDDLGRRVMTRMVAAMPGSSGGTAAVQRAGTNPRTAIPPRRTRRHRG